MARQELGLHVRVRLSRGRAEGSWYELVVVESPRGNVNKPVTLIKIAYLLVYCQILGSDAAPATLQLVAEIRNWVGSVTFIYIWPVAART